MKIIIFYDNINYRIREGKEVLKLVEKVIRKEGKIPGDLYFVITTDKELLKINKEFLGNNSLTDVIAFDYSEKNKINGEIYISKETVKRNSINYKVSLKNEMMRVMIHGTLHLCGYDDKNEKERKKMTEEENEWLIRMEEKK